MSFSATVWEWNESEAAMPGNPVRIEQCRQMDGSILYAVRQTGCCLSRTGEWEREPIPSSRDDEFLARCRFETWQEAALAIERHVRNPRGRFAK